MSYIKHKDFRVDKFVICNPLDTPNRWWVSISNKFEEHKILIEKLGVNKDAINCIPIHSVIKITKIFDENDTSKFALCLAEDYTGEKVIVCRGWLIDYE